MGTVYAAVDRRTGAPCAVKVIKMGPPDPGPRAEELFRREMEICRVLTHPHVVHTYSTGAVDGQYFVVMELCSDGSLAERVRHSGPLPIRIAVEMLLGVLGGLQYAHTAPVGAVTGVVHRDIKPQNILLAPSTQGRQIAKVADFGLSKAYETAGLSGLTRTGAVAGTPAFMPREQVIDYKYARPAVDVWAAAATLYYALTGCPPRDFPPGRDPWLIVCTEKPVRIAKRGVVLPVGFAELLDRALDDEGELMFASAADFAAALRDAQRGSGT